MSGPLCFVLMPFDKKVDPSTGRPVDFDAVYRDLIAPAVVAAGMEVVRADEEVVGGVIHKAMYERLILCDFAVADLTTANANVFYELGLRHAVRPWSTVSIFADGTRLPFDVAPLRGIPYRLGADGRPARAGDDQRALADRLAEARRLAQEDVADSPVFQMVTALRRQEIPHAVTDVFRDRVRAAEGVKRELAAARRVGVEAVRAVQRRLEQDAPIAATEAAVVIDLFLSYRAVKAWTDMVDLVPRMTRPLGETVLVQEQCALALNRAGRSEEAEEMLLALIERRGPSPETYGLLGRVYKDRWDGARARGDERAARGLLERAIGAYTSGFEADWRDAYPGVNAVTLMEVREPPDERRTQLLPLVRYAVDRKVAAGRPDYWDHATRLELAVLAGDAPAADRALDAALAAEPAPWEAETTARNLRLIREARARRGTAPPWARAAEDELQRRAEA
jgi:tetratricopeptide (TPR) repeat protein